MDLLEQSFLTPLDPTALAQLVNSPPFIAIDGTVNFRDLGNLSIPNYPGKSLCGCTHKTKLQKVFRSAQLSNLRADGKARIQSLGIKVIFDFRSACEINLYDGSKLDLPGIEVRHVPVMDEDYFHPSEVKRREKIYEMCREEGLVEEYQSFLDSAGPSFGSVFRYMRDFPEHAIIVHCALGKDRTGLFVALLLMSLGVSDDDICYDYALSRAGLERGRTFILSLMTESEEVCIAMMSSSQSIMRKTLALIRSRYGGAEQYLLSKCGLTVKDCELVRESLLMNSEGNRCNSLNVHSRC